jgi:hypothetical protein
LRLAVGSPPITDAAAHGGSFFSRQIAEADVAPPPPVYVRLAEAQLNKAQVGLRRVEKLYASEVALGRSNTEIDEARADVAVAQATLVLRQYESQQRPPPAPAVAPPRFMPRWERNGWEGFWIRLRHNRVPPGTNQLPGVKTGRWVEFPFWMPFLLAAAPLAFAGRAARQRRVRLRRGLCLSCGYDLRGGGERCPECGTPASAVPPP